MRLQLFKGTYGVLLVMAMTGLFMMLRRQTGSVNALALWLVLILLAVVGLLVNASEGFAAGGAALGLLSTLYLRLGGIHAPVGYGRVDLVLVVYAVLTAATGYVAVTRGRSRTPVQ